jgi:flagellar protein FlbD
MVELTKLTGEKIVVNSELILYIEETPDTLVTFRDGQHLMVREKAEEVVRRAVEYKRLARAPWSAGGAV